MSVRIRDLSHIAIDDVEFSSAGATVRGLLYHSGRPAACVILCHGYSAGKHNVDPLAYHLASEGYISLAFDFQGHKLGASSRPLVRAEDLVVNAVDAIAFAKRHALVKRAVVGGHSMGAATAIGAALQSSAAEGIILMSTARHRSANFAADGLVRGLINRRVYVDGAGPEEITAAMDAHTTRIAELAPRPVLFVAGSKDALVAPSATKQLFDEAGEPKTYELIEANHTDCAERARFVVTRWLKATGFEYAAQGG
ncbi:MAG: alpha/beta fold hydrolase [Candidatus Eremiobacteraeota bacterium]|nr:alpha/beta fold hydrolase [Candidatus Eremiobacteraeota bacterium]